MNPFDGRVNRMGRTQRWVTTTANSVNNATLGVRNGDWPDILGDHPANDGWTGIAYSGGGIFTVNETGNYWIDFGFNWASGSARRLLFMWVDQGSPSTANSFMRRTDSIATADAATFLSQMQTGAYLTAGQALQFGIYQTSGAALGATTTGGLIVGGTAYSQYLEITRRS